jgi:hypothetical protein
LQKLLFTQWLAVLRGKYDVTVFVMERLRHFRWM